MSNWLRDFCVLLAPWMFAGLLTGAIPVIGLLVGPLSGARRMIPTVVPLAAHWPLQPATVEALASVAIAYLGLGLLLTIGRVFRPPTGCERAAIACETFAAAALLFVLPLLAALWTVAWRMDVLPWGSWGVEEGNHGPWRRIPDLRRVLWFILGLPGISMLLARLSLLLRPNPLVRGLIVAGIVTWGILIATHYWLID